METLGFQGRTQTQLDAYKTLSRQHASAQTEAADAAWMQRRPSSDGTGAVTFSTYLLPFSYAFFGSPQRGKCRTISGRERVVATPDTVNSLGRIGRGSKAPRAGVATTLSLIFGFASPL